MGRHHDHAASGQPYCRELYKPERRNDLQTAAVPVSDSLVELVHRTKHYTVSGTPSRSTQHGSGRRVKIHEGSVQLDAQSSNFRPNTNEDGSIGSGSFCLTIDEATFTLLQLETGSGSGSNRRLPAGLGGVLRVCQPTLVLDSSMLDQGKISSGTDRSNNSIVENPIMVSSDSGAVGGLSSETPSDTGPSNHATRTGIPDVARSTSTNRVAHLRKSFTSRGFSPQATDLMLASWRDKTSSNYGSSFSRWAGWCQQRGRDPTVGPIEDVINFLADLFSKGYQ